MRRAFRLSPPNAGWPALLLMALLWLASLWPALAGAQPLQPVPAPSARVIDLSGTLDAQQVQALEEKLAAFERERGTQIVILMVPTTAPEDVAAYAFRVADSWKIGRREVGDGILLVVAKNDRRIRIEVARALEGAVPDVMAFRIIDRVITPAFRQGDFAGGLSAGADALMARIRGEDLPLPERAAAGAEEKLSLEDLGAFLFVGVPIAGAILVGMLGRKLGALATGGVAGFVAKLLTGSLLLGGLAGVLAAVFVLVLGIGGGGRGGPGRPYRGGGPIIGGGGGGGFGGGGGGGGFSSGGGGSFGGGGASGSW